VSLTICATSERIDSRESARSRGQSPAPVTTERRGDPFYPGRVDAAWIGDERVQGQDSDFYGGWITTDLVGPFKGPPGTLGW
jgi:hypothetical protein